MTRFGNGVTTNIMLPAMIGTPSCPFPLDVEKCHIDALSADGHKWLLGPEGAGIFYLRRELVDRLHPVGIGWNSVVGSRRFSKMKVRIVNNERNNQKEAHRAPEQARKAKNGR